MMRAPRLSSLTLLTLAALSAAPARSFAENQQEATPPPAPPPAETEPVKRVVHIPEALKAELREEIRRDVLEQAKREGWAAPDVVPSWLSRIKLSGDVRVRLERDLFNRNNASGGEFPDFNAINSGRPFDVNFVDPANERYLNVDQNRTRPRLRARLGLAADLGLGFSTEVRLASGESPNPGSENQTLGGSGGFFSKYPLWIDRAQVRFAPLRDASLSLAVQLGRFENPFIASEMIFSPDVNLDGLALVASGRVSDAVRPFLVAGAFPVYTTGFAFPAESPEKFLSRNKWLYAVQGGADLSLGSDVALKVALAFYDFDGVEGISSNPCDTNLSFITCDADDTRPSFAQKGNTYRALRTPSALAEQLEAAGTVPRYQFFGLASRFRELVGSARLEVKASPSLLAGAAVEYVRNNGFRRSEVEVVALNNRGPTQGINDLGEYRGGNEGWFAQLSIGSPKQQERWDWRIRASYSWIQSDAVLDALNGQDFGLGGTNLKGYTLEATLWVARGIALGARWLSADQIVGPPFGVDVLQIDLMARF